MKFLNKTCICNFKTDGSIELLQTITIETAKGLNIEIPKGFVCNASSVPRFFWRICGAPRSPINLRAGILHDYIYDQHIFPRKTCDKLYYEALRCLGKSWIISKMMYYAVRLFGGSHY